MIDLYNHGTYKFADAGLQLRLPVDLVPQGQYSRHNNLVSLTEGQLQARAGLTPIATISDLPLHTLFRLNQQASSSSPSQRLFGSDINLFGQILPNGTIDEINISNGTGWDGNPLSVIDYRFDFDPHSWAIIANASGMAKVRALRGPTTVTSTFSIASTAVIDYTVPPAFTYTVLEVETTVANTISAGTQVSLSGLTTHPEWNGLTDTVFAISSPTKFQILVTAAAYAAIADTGTVSVTQNQSAQYLGWVLGQRPPTSAASASDGGAGNLNNGSGPGYDWRYTYVNSILNSESNPSAVSGTIGTQYPTANVNPDTTIVPNYTVAVDSRTRPWNITGGINLAFQYGDGTGLPPVVVPATLVSGSLITISYLSGTVRCSDSRPPVNGAGQSNAITGTSTGSTGNRFPTYYMPGSNLGLGGLCGAFCDGTGQVIQPLSIGLGGTFIVPLGATKLQLGIDDDRLSDNTGSFSVQVSGIPTTGCTNPTQAYDGSDTTFALFAGGVGGTANGESCQFSSWASMGTVLGISLDIDSEVKLVGGGTPGDLSAAIQYSIDSGTSWSTLYQTSTTRARKPDRVTFAVAIDVTQLRVRAFAQGINSGQEIDLMLYKVSTQTDDGSVTVLALTNRKALVCCKAPTDPQQDTIRLYRRGGSLVDGWKKVSDYPISKLSPGGCGADSFELEDNVPDSELTSELELDNDMPVSGISATNTPLSFIWGPSNRRVLGVGDPSRPEAVYFSKPGNADQWPPQNWLAVSSPSDPMVAGCIFNTRNFAFSRERMWELVEGLVSGVTYSSYPTPTLRGLISPWAMCVYDRIYFVAKDGIYATTGGAEQSIVENDIKPLFPTKDSPGQAVHGYEAVDMTQTSLIRLSAHNDELYFTYAGVSTGAIQQLIFDIRKQRWRAAQYTPSAHVFYSEPGTTSSLLVGGANGVCYQTARGMDDQTPITCSLRTGSHDMGQPLSLKEFGSVVVDLDTGGADNFHPITITPYINGEQLQQSAIQISGGGGSGRGQFPLNLQDTMAYNLELEVSWTQAASVIIGELIQPILYQYDILYRPEPTSVTHWEARENSYGMPGYFHLRDGYIGLRSQMQTALSFYADGSLSPFYTINLPATGNLRKRLYFSLPGGYKFRVLRVTLDVVSLPQVIDSPFQIYEQDVEFRIKPWLGVMGYQRVRMVGGETQMASGAWASNALGGEQ